MSGIFPATPAPETIQLGSTTPTFTSVTHSLRRQVRARGVQQWSFHLAYPPLNRSEHATLNAFCLAQRGQLGRFSFVLPIHSVPLGAASGSPRVDGSGQLLRDSNGMMRVQTKGWTPSVNRILRSGDFIKFNGHSKAYALIADADSDATGSALLTIEPSPISPLIDDEAIIVADVPFTCALAADNLSVKLSGGPWYKGIELSLVEVL
ncbi:MAG: hypothetical protein H7838_10105 [Magnetococcus sp. DMHC-8]